MNLLKNFFKVCTFSKFYNTVEFYFADQKKNPEIINPLKMDPINNPRKNIDFSLIE